MISATQSALSALQAYSTKIEANSNNVANRATEGYKRTRVTLSENQQGGVRTNIQKTDTPGPTIYDQTATGLERIELSNVDLGREFPEMMMNTHFFKANLKTLQTADVLFGNILDLKA
jgi:flagellar basal-body rod protein FlgC